MITTSICFAIFLILRITFQTLAPKFGFLTKLYLPFDIICAVFVLATIIIIVLKIRNAATKGRDKPDKNRRDEH